MRRRILEREFEIAQLAEAAREALAGRGCVVLVSGEAGIGKSSLVEAARGCVPAEGRMLVGRCDDLSTARTLGPFRDLIGAVGRELTAALSEGADRDRVLSALRSELDWPGHPTLLAIEDAHWADDATLDVLRYLVRRIESLPVVLMLTYRDDELGREHPLRQLLGIASGNARRLPLRRLSAEAVQELGAGGQVDPAEVFAITSGNPFFVSELLAAGGARSVPRTVVDAVHGRLNGLDRVTRTVVDQLSVVPTAIDRELVNALVPGGLSALTAAEERGLLTVAPNRVAFRHELTRRAIADALPAIRRTVLNAQVLAALAEDPAADPARLMHHAAAAGDRAAIVRYGPAAAREAAAGGARREAAAHYRTVLEYADAFDPAGRAALLEGYAVECQTVGQAHQAVAAQQRAVELRRQLGDPGAVAAGLCSLTRMQWWSGDRTGSEASAREAVEVLAGTGGRLLARAYSSVAVSQALAYRATEAESWAERAVELARAAGDDAVLAYSLNNLGTARWHLGRPDGRELIEESLRIALAAGELDHACRAHANIGWELLNRFQLDQAEPVIDAGIELAERAEHFGFLDFLYVQRARLEFGRCAWDEAIGSADLVAGTALPGIRCAAHTVVGRIRVRRGAASAELTTAGALAREMREPIWLGPVLCAEAEAAWLRGDPARVLTVAGAAYDEFAELNAEPISSELRYWLAKAGKKGPIGAAAGGDTPYGLLADGRWRAAAEEWDRAGCRYERALALAESPESADLLTALDEAEALGAKPLARIVRGRLRALGVAAVPRGPVATTRQNPAGLTRRQLEVLRLLADGLSNAEIADRLVLSTRTAGNHVAAVLEKLGVRNRAEAAERGRHLTGDIDSAN